MRCYRHIQRGCRLCYGVDRLKFSLLQDHQLSTAPPSNASADVPAPAAILSTLGGSQAPEGAAGTEVSPANDPRASSYAPSSTPSWVIITGVLGVAILCALVFGVFALLPKRRRAAASQAGRNQVRRAIYDPFICSLLLNALE